MRAAIYGKLQKVATGLLRDKFPMDAITLVRPQRGNGPPSDPGRGVASRLSLSGVARGVPSSFIRDGLAREGDLLFTVAVIAGENEPGPGEQVEFTDPVKGGLVLWRIVSRSPKPPLGTRVVWSFIARGLNA